MVGYQLTWSQVQIMQWVALLRLNSADIQTLQLTWSKPLPFPCSCLDRTGLMLQWCLSTSRFKWYRYCKYIKITLQKAITSISLKYLRKIKFLIKDSHFSCKFWSQNLLDKKQHFHLLTMTFGAPMQESCCLNIHYIVAMMYFFQEVTFQNGSTLRYNMYFSDGIISFLLISTPLTYRCYNVQGSFHFLLSIRWIRSSCETFTTIWV
jgi:hypothetical protein